MRKTSIVLAAGIVASLSTLASAQSNFFFDIRNNTGASPNGQPITAPLPPFTVGQGFNTTTTNWPNDGLAGGGKGNGQILRLMPQLSNNLHSNPASPGFGNSWPNFDADGNCSTGDLNLFADVGADDAGTDGVISSVGIDATISAPGARYAIASASWAWTLNDTTVPVNYGFAPGTPTGPGGQLGFTGAKYVKVPVSGASVYATAGGLTQNTLTMLGRIRVTAGFRNQIAGGCTPNAAHASGSTFSVSLGMNNLLITRTYSTVTTPANVDEIVSFGYTGGAVDATFNGSTGPAVGAPDATIQVRMKADANGDGRATAPDLGTLSPLINAPAATISQGQRYLWDMNGINTGAPITPADIAAISNLVAIMTPGTGLCP